MFVQQSSPIFYFFIFFLMRNQVPFLDTIKLKSPWCVKIMVWKIGKFRQYFGEISDIGGGRNKIGHLLSIEGKIAPKICKISLIFRWLADFSAKISSVTAHVHDQGKTSKKRAKKSTIFWKITNLSLINC